MLQPDQQFCAPRERIDRYNPPLAVILGVLHGLDLVCLPGRDHIAHRVHPAHNELSRVYQQVVQPIRLTGVQPATALRVVVVTADAQRLDKYISCHVSARARFDFDRPLVVAVAHYKVNAKPLTRVGIRYRFDRPTLDVHPRTH